MSTPGWRTDLARAIEAGRTTEGPEAVAEAITTQLQLLSADPDAPVEPWCPPVPVLATIDCASGRLGVLLRTDGRVTVHLASTQQALVAQVGTETEEGFWLAEEAGGAAAQDRDQLARAGIVIPGWYSGSGFTEDDLLAACSVLLTARP